MTVSSDGIVTYNKVTVFLDQEPTVTSIYQSIQTNLNYTIDLTGNHLIYRRKDTTDKFHAMKVYFYHQIYYWKSIVENFRFSLYIFTFFKSKQNINFTLVNKQSIYFDLFSFRYANKVSIGDEVLIQRNDEMTATKVINITKSLMQGKYYFYSSYLQSI